MSARSRRRHSGRPTGVLPATQPSLRPAEPEPERLLLDAIAAGELDAHLTAINDATIARFELLETINSAKALARLNVGDIVRFNRKAKPRYLHGEHATVVDVDGQSATVRLHRAVGRFSGGEIPCPPLILDRLQPGV